MQRYYIKTKFKGCRFIVGKLEIKCTKAMMKQLLYFFIKKILSRYSFLFESIDTILGDKYEFSVTLFF